MSSSIEYGSDFPEGIFVKIPEQIRKIVGAVALGVAALTSGCATYTYERPISASSSVTRTCNPKTGVCTTTTNARSGIESFSLGSKCKTENSSTTRDGVTIYAQSRTICNSYDGSGYYRRR